MPLVNYAPEGSMTIDGFSMNRPAFAIVGDERGEGGYVKLWADFDVRGEDRTLPSVTGVIAYPRRMTVTRVDFRLLVVGDVDQAGAPTADSVVGLQDNIEYIRASIVAPVVTPTGTRAAILTMPSGATRSAAIHVLGVVTQSYGIAECGSIWIGTLQVSIPGGRFS